VTSHSRVTKDYVVCYIEELWFYSPKSFPILCVRGLLFILKELFIFKNSFKCIKIVMFQNVNKHWRGHWKRLFRVTGVRRGSIWAPLGVHRGSIGDLSGILWGSNRGQSGVCVNEAIACSPNDLSNVCFHFGTKRS
jgi:hypothetical protein